MIALLYVAARLGVELGGTRFAYRSHSADLAQSPIVADCVILLLMVALWQLAEMLRAIAAGDYFSMPAIRRFRRFAFWLLLVALTGFAGPIAAALLGSDAAPQALELRIDLRQFLMVLVTLFLFLLARLLERAREFEQESREIV